MQQRSVMIAGGLSFIVGALAFLSVFTWLATNFDYPGVLDGSAADVLPRLREGGSMMRAVWALYAFLPLLLVPGAVGTLVACPSSKGRMILALVFASVGALAMCLGLLRWPSIHWVLAEAYTQAGPETRSSLSAMFLGLNLYLGNYVGEFLSNPPYLNTRPKFRVHIQARKRFLFQQLAERTAASAMRVHRSPRHLKLSAEHRA